MKKSIIVFCLIAFANIVNSQDYDDKPTYKWNLHLNFSMPDLNPEVILWTIVDFDPTEKFIKDFNLKYLESQLKDAKNENQKKMQIRVANEVGWDLLFSAVRGDNVYLLTNKGCWFSSSSNGTDDNFPITKKWLISKTFLINGESYCFAIPVNTLNGESMEIKLDKSNMISLLDIYKNKIEPKK